MLPREPYKIKNISFIANIDDVGDELAIIRMELEIPESDEILAVINKVCDTCLERRMFSPHVLQEFRLLCANCLFGDTINASFIMARDDNELGRVGHISTEGNCYIFLWEIFVDSIRFHLREFPDHGFTSCLEFMFDMKKIVLGGPQGLMDNACYIKYTGISNTRVTRFREDTYRLYVQSYPNAEDEMCTEYNITVGKK
jgi:hypothetical protein